MHELTPKPADKELVLTSRERSANERSGRRSVPFKYYIHDSVSSLRLQLAGDFAEADVSELNGCWNTAKTTLGQRKLILDLHGLKSADYAAKQWLLSMASRGAACLPDSYLQSAVTPQETASQPARGWIFSKLAAMLRGSRIVPAAESSTQAQ